MTRPLENIRVLDLTVALAGPFCTQQLSLMGAEVLHINPPAGGYRDHVFSKTPVELQRRLFGTNFGNKKEITLNLKSEKGREIFIEMLKQSDVVVQNFSPGTMEKLGLSYEVMRGINPRVIYCAISGFGQTGVWKDKLAYDALIQATTGLMSVNGFPDREPVRVGPPFADMIGGLYGALGILLALHARETITGEGQMIDCAMFDSVFSMLQEAVAVTLLNGKSQERIGNRYPFASPWNVFPASDGKPVYVACQTDTQCKRTLLAIGRADLAEEDWPLARRVNEADRLEEMVAAWVRTKTREEVEAVLMESDVPCAPVMEMIEVINHPHTKSRDMLLAVDDMYGRIDNTIGIAPKLSATPGGLDWGIMASGSSNEEVYSRLLGLSREDVGELRVQGVI